MRKVVVTGGNGFIGSSLIERLVAEGVEVHALVNENHQRLDLILPAGCIHVLEDGVVSSAALVSRIEPDTIFHLAAVYAEPVSSESVLSMINGNLTLGACLLYAATQCRVPPVFVNTGTYWQFDSNAMYSPNTLYAATKHAFQDLLQFYRDRLGIASLTLVLYDTFGETDVRPKLWRQLTSAAPGEVFLLSEGEQIIHLVHIDDIVGAFFIAAELLHKTRPVKPIYSVSSPRPVKLRTMVEELTDRAGLEVDLRWGAKPYWDGQILQPWVGHVLPNWRAEVDVLEALVQMARRSQLVAPGKGPSGKTRKTNP